jgi:uroporphyrinogen decarboxylase
MIPSRMTRKPFWDVYLFQNPPLWKAYAAAARRFCFDAWSTGTVGFKFGKTPAFDFRPREVSKEKIIGMYEIGTPAGRIKGEITFMRSDPPTQSGKAIKNLAEDLPKLKWLLDNITGFTFDEYEKRREEIGDMGLVGLDVAVPGLHVWSDWFNHEQAVYAVYDTPDLIEEFRALTHEFIMRILEAVIEKRPDNINIQSSGGITLQSPSLFRKLSLPTLKEITRRARDAGIPTLMHSCGKARVLVTMCAEETDLDCLNPLEAPPLGDCDLAEVKRSHGAKLSLMGNLPTTTLMLNGTPEEVRAAARTAIDAAAEGGGFILSTGDQCGRDTPDENIFAMIEEAGGYGVY